MNHMFLLIYLELRAEADQMEFLGYIALIGKMETIVHLETNPSQILSFACCPLCLRIFPKLDRRIR